MSSQAPHSVSSRRDGLSSFKCKYLLLLLLLGPAKMCIHVDNFPEMEIKLLELYFILQHFTQGLVMF